MSGPLVATEDEIAARVDHVRLKPEHRDRLVELLAEQHPAYAGRSTNAAIRIKGYVLAAFEDVGLPAAALPYVLEELESGRSPYLVAAAARALRGLDRPAEHLVPFLLRAIENVRYVDDALSFAGYWARWPAPNPTTAVAEMVKTLAWIGADAASARPAHHGCCSGTVHAVPADREAAVTGPVPDVEMEDQDGRSARFDELVLGHLSIVTFFYTRCENPNKCSLTITKLARLQRALQEEGLQDQVHTLAVTYDPGYDVPPRLRTYGENRGIHFTAGNRLLRSPQGFDALRRYFDLGVNFGPALVNMHRIELFVLHRDGRIHSTFARLQWDLDEVLDRARALALAGQVAGPGEPV